MFLSYKKSITNSYFLVLLIALGIVLPGLVMAAEVRVEPISGTYALGKTFTATVAVVPDEVSVNAVDVSLKFDPSIFLVVDVNKDKSDLTRWTTEPTFSNSQGTISFAGISEDPFTNVAELLTITFRTLTPGDGGLVVENASVYATDGLRTNVFTAGASATFTVSSNTEVVDESVPEPTQPQVDNSLLNSKEFSDPEVWYNTYNGSFDWELPADVEAVAVEITSDPDNRPNNNPEAIYETPIHSLTITQDIAVEGVQYLSLRFKNEDGWGEIVKRKLLIDTVPPEPFSVEVINESPTEFPVLHFDAVDFTSGIAGYEILVPGKESVMLAATEVKSGYKLSELEDGTYSITVTAYDRASNSRASKVEAVVSAGWKNMNANSDANTTKNVFSVIPNLSIYILGAIIILLLVHFYFERKRIKIKEAKLHKETLEIQSQMEKIFSALRDEIYDQINAITKRKRLSKAEKEAIEGLQQAIEVSESLIEKEINDVKKVLK